MTTTQSKNLNLKFPVTPNCYMLATPSFKPPHREFSRPSPHALTPKHVKYTQIARLMRTKAQLSSHLNHHSCRSYSRVKNPWNIVRKRLRQKFTWLCSKSNLGIWVNYLRTLSWKKITRIRKFWSSIVINRNLKFLKSNSSTWVRELSKMI